MYIYIYIYIYIYTCTLRVGCSFVCQSGHVFPDSKVWTSSKATPF